MLEEWQIKALENDLLDYIGWADSAVSAGLYSTADEALADKANKCAKRLITMHESIYGPIDPTKTIPEKVMICVNTEGYENREQRDSHIEEV